MSNFLNRVIRQTMLSHSRAISHVTVIGSGLMGSGIAQVGSFNFVDRIEKKSVESKVHYIFNYIFNLLHI